MNNEVRVVVYETQWSKQDYINGYTDKESEESELSFTVSELARELKFWMPSQSHLHKCRDIFQVWFSRTDYIDGEPWEVSLHLHSEATDREKRIWSWAIQKLIKDTETYQRQIL